MAASKLGVRSESRGTPRAGCLPAGDEWNWPQEEGVESTTGCSHIIGKHLEVSWIFEEHKVGGTRLRQLAGLRAWLVTF